MIQIFPAEKRYIQRMGWLDVYSVFSCNNYFDPWNTHFANLIAFNEYVMQPGFGFNMHPHEDIEQVFLVTEGQLSLCRQPRQRGRALNPGAYSPFPPVPATPGTPATGETLACRYLAAWFTPNALRMTPRYAGALFPGGAHGEPRTGSVSGSPELLRAFHEFPAPRHQQQRHPIYPAPPRLGIPGLRRRRGAEADTTSLGACCGSTTNTSEKEGMRASKGKKNSGWLRKTKRKSSSFPCGNEQTKESL